MSSAFSFVSLVSPLANKRRGHPHLPSVASVVPPGARQLTSVAPSVALQLTLDGPFLAHQKHPTPAGATENATDTPFPSLQQTPIPDAPFSARRPFPGPCPTHHLPLGPPALFPSPPHPHRLRRGHPLRSSRGLPIFQAAAFSLDFQ